MKEKKRKKKEKKKLLSRFDDSKKFEFSTAKKDIGRFKKVASNNIEFKPVRL